VNVYSGILEDFDYLISEKTWVANLLNVMLDFEFGEMNLRLESKLPDMEKWMI
jgi:hypothetical protein